MRPRRPSTALVLLCVLAAPAQAQTFYDVEIIVFEHGDTRASEQERWRPRVVLPDLEGATAFERDGTRADELEAPPRGFQPLPADRSRLQAELERLEESEHYRVLRHVLWRQPALEGDQAVALRLRAGEPMTIRIPADTYTAASERGAGAERGDDAGGEPGQPSAPTDADDTRPAGGTRDEANVAPLDDAGVRAAGPFGGDTLVPRTREVRAHPLDGTIRLVVTRYLHLYTDLYFTTPVEWLGDEAAGAPAVPGGGPAADSRAAGHPGVAGAAMAPRVARNADGQAMLSYPFVQRRRMRSNELHYLDHPVLGMLVRITPRGDGDELPVPDAGAS